MSDNNNFDFLDALSAVSFLMGLANYRQNLGQTDAQEVAEKVMNVINNHLVEQDKKIDQIIEYLKEGEKHA